MKSAVDLLKLFFEKGFITTLVSLALTGVIFCITPNDFIMLVKLTNVGYCFLLFIGSFLLVEILYRLLKSLYKFGKIIFTAFLYAMKQERKSNDLWEMLGKANDDDYEIVIKLLETDNEPMLSRFRMGFSSNISDWFEESCDYGTHFYYYWLKEEEYQLLKESMKSHLKKYKKKKTNEEAK